MANKTIIKRLQQNGEDFVPISVAEAIVVNTTNIQSLSQLGITTLDKVLTTLSTEIDNFKNTGNSTGLADLYRIVDSLPTASEECLNKIYLLSKGTDQPDQFEEYICISYQLGQQTYYTFEKLGTISMNFSSEDYYTKEEVNNVLQGYVTTTDGITVDDVLEGSDIFVNYNIEAAYSQN